VAAFTWSTGAQRYRGADGRFLSNRTVRSAVDDLVDASAARMQNGTLRLQAGEISLDQCQAGMATEMRLSHLSLAIAARGGRYAMGPADYGWTGQILRTEYGYLQRWKADIAAGAAPMDGRLIARAALYAQSARGTFEAMKTRTAVESGRPMEERNELHAAEHCIGCLGETARGWVPLGELLPIGTRSCLSNCRCTIVRRLARRRRAKAA
jgi:hypothetical protein